MMMRGMLGSRALCAARTTVLLPMRTHAAASAAIAPAPLPSVAASAVRAFHAASSLQSPPRDDDADDDAPSDSSSRFSASSSRRPKSPKKQARDLARKFAHEEAKRADASENKEPSLKTQAFSGVYTAEELAPASVFQAPKHPNSRLAIHGVGVPAVHVVQRPKPRRATRPQSVQDVPKPMKTYTEGPREMGYNIVRTYIGHVVSDKMQKTVAVEVSQYYRHPKYHKYIKTSRKFLTHDEDEECNVGDVVEIRVCRPLSRHKHFTLHRIVKPKLLIDEGASRFEQHRAIWKGEGVAPEDSIKMQVEVGTEAMRKLAEKKAQKEANYQAAKSHAQAHANAAQAAKAATSSL